MGLEAVTYISDLVITNPVAGDPRNEGDDHIRNIKKAIKASFPDLAGPLYITPGTITTSKPFALSQTWNDGAVTFKASTIAVTDTASAAGSLLADWTVGGTSKFSVTKAGLLTAVTIAGTLTTAAQPNVTSVGTLTSLSTSGTITVAHAAQAILLMDYTGAGAIKASLSTYASTAAWYDETNTRAILVFNGSTNQLSTPTLAGVGTRTVVVDANGVLRAP